MLRNLTLPLVPTYPAASRKFPRGCAHKSGGWGAPCVILSRVSEANGVERSCLISRQARYVRLRSSGKRPLLAPLSMTSGAACRRRRAPQSYIAISSYISCGQQRTVSLPHKRALTIQPHISCGQLVPKPRAKPRLLREMNKKITPHEAELIF